MGVFSELFSDDSTAGLKDVVQINFQLVEISLEKVIDRLLCVAQIQFHVFQADFHIVRKLLGSILHVLVCYKGANHAKPESYIEPWLRYVVFYRGNKQIGKLFRSGSFPLLLIGCIYLFVDTLFIDTDIRLNIPLRCILAKYKRKYLYTYISVYFKIVN